MPALRPGRALPSRAQPQGGALASSALLLTHLVSMKRMWARVPMQSLSMHGSSVRTPRRPWTNIASCTLLGTFYSQARPAGQAGRGSCGGAWPRPQRQEAAALTAGPTPGCGPGSRLLGGARPLGCGPGSAGRRAPCCPACSRPTQLALCRSTGLAVCGCCAVRIVVHLAVQARGTALFWLT
jgi:hypothetical protein